MATQNVQFCYTHLVSTPASTSLLPTPYAFDQGFLTLSAFNLNSGGTAVARIFLPTNVHPDTVWAYGPEPTNSTPHWFQFTYDGVTGAEIQPYFVYLHLLDGGRGDSDGLTNGAINGLVFGLARAINAPPPLQITVGAPGTVVLTWPAAFQDSANTFLEVANGLGSTNVWQFVPDVPLQSGGQNTLAEPVGVTARFYRLHSQ
jgi:hypothetical protein